uniref:Pancreatic trypsin inhibitor n=1 Tax=Rhipicephalus zambeziensis TaxID=60191 RepID=A0A224YCM8_9ACAR
MARRNTLFILLLAIFIVLQQGTNAVPEPERCNRQVRPACDENPCTCDPRSNFGEQYANVFFYNATINKCQPQGEAQNCNGFGEEDLCNRLCVRAAAA